MRKIRCWKDVTKNRKQYGERNMDRYNSPFMILDTKYLFKRK